MEKVEILKTIKEVLMNEDLQELAKLRSELEEEVRKDNYISSPSDKKKVATIKKILSKNDEIRPLLSSFTRYNNGVAFTDSYQLYVLNDEYLPFKVACSTDEDREYAKQHNLETVAGVYPNLKAVIPEEYETTYEIDTNEFLLWSKTTPKDEDKKLLYKFKVGETDYCFDGQYLLNAINILKIKDPKITLELRGNYKPITLHNKDNELGLILPIRSY